MWLLVGAFLLVVGEAAIAFVTLDLIFRRIDLTPGRLRDELRRYGVLYAAAGSLFCAGGAWAQWRLAGWAGIGAALLNWLPWWMLWRFGLRKQFTYLFKSDGGRPAGTEKPDP